MERTAANTGTDGHQFNETDLPGVVYRQSNEVFNLILIETANQNSVQL